MKFNEFNRLRSVERFKTLSGQNEVIVTDNPDTLKENTLNRAWDHPGSNLPIPPNAKLAMLVEPGTTTPISHLILDPYHDPESDHLVYRPQDPGAGNQFDFYRSVRQWAEDKYPVNPGSVYFGGSNQVLFHNSNQTFDQIENTLQNNPQKYTEEQQNAIRQVIKRNRKNVEV